MGSATPGSGLCADAAYLLTLLFFWGGGGLIFVWCGLSARPKFRKLWYVVDLVPISQMSYFKVDLGTKDMFWLYMNMINPNYETRTILNMKKDCLAPILFSFFLGVNSL
jgi:hypothetical protein